jgi:diguanylate cyclase (GGDEF)-like protein
MLAGLFSAIGLMATAFSTIAPFPSRFAGVDAAVVVLSALAALAALLLPRRWEYWFVPLGVGAATVLITVLVGVRATPQGNASVGYLLALESLYCAVYLTYRWMLVQVGLLCTLFAAASIVGGGDLQPFYVGLCIATALLIAVVVSGLVARQRNLIAETRGQAVHDALTGALNRRGAVEEAEHVRSVVQRAGALTTVSVVDLDEFKLVNDRLGHAAGDQLLVGLVADWSSTLRTGDVLARVGGDEFIVVLPQTDAESAQEVLGRMRDANSFPWSVGTVVWQPGEDLFVAAARADELLYAHKLRRRIPLAEHALDG